MNEIDQIEVVAGYRSDGTPVLERLPARRAGPGRYVLTGSPGLAQGAAAGDVVEILDDRSFRVISRGGNLAVQVLGNGFDDAAFDELESAVTALGGWLDGGHDRVRVFTIPVSAGFAAVESALDAYVLRGDGAEWYFTNVYDESDGVTPLNWWHG